MRIAIIALALAACGESPALVDAYDRERVALVPVTPKHDVDILYVIDDSASTLHMQTSLKDALPAFLDELAHGGALPSLHIGAITSDLGVLATEDPAPGPPIGSGPGACSGSGKDGALQAYNPSVLTGSFISDAANSDGTRTVNYSGTLQDAFATIVSAGSSGCGFEQPLEAMRRALDAHPSNVGFLRPEAVLAIIPLQDEDDCSMAHASLVGTDTAMLGPLQSFRCTRFGVVCSDGGRTTDEMNVLGDKANCHWNDDSAYLVPRARYESFLETIKPNPRDVLFMPIAAGATSLEVEPRTPPGGGTAIPALAHECQWMISNGPAVADPAVRMRDLTRAVVRGRMASVCNADLGPIVRDIAREIRGMLGDSCLTRDILLPADCRVYDETLDAATELQPCSTSTTTNCYSLVEDPACTTSQHLRVDVVRSTPPPADTMVAVRCRL